MTIRIWEAGLVILAVFGRLSCAEPFKVLSSPVCPVNSIADSVLGFQETSCPRNRDEWIQSIHAVGVMEGDEVSFHRALRLVYENSNDYVAVLFYASWCPFSRTFRPTLPILASLYPSIPHFAIEETVVRPSILSKYGVHGFPTLFLLNSTMHMRYHGSRTLGSLVAFYNDVAGKTAPLDRTSLETIGLSSDHKESNNDEQESCPFSWAISPENLLQQETYLALATAFVVLRLLYSIFPTLFAFVNLAWRRYILNIRLRSLVGRPLAYLNRAIQLFNYLKEPCKRSNLQAWASKSLASVSFGDSSTSQ